MRPSELKSLKDYLTAIRAELSSLNKVAEDHVAAIRDATQTDDEKQREIPGIVIAAVNASNEHIPAHIKAQRDRENSNRDRELRLQKHVLYPMWVTAGATCLAFAAAAYYAGVAYRQQVTMSDTFGQIKQQTALMRQETIGNQGAILVFDPALSAPAIVASVRPIPGRVAAKDVRVRMIAQRISLPDKKPIGNPIPCDIDVAQVVASESPSLTLLSGSIHACYLPDFDQLAMDEIMHTRQSVSIRGTFSYTNGFDELKTQSFCRVYLGYRFSGFIRGDSSHPTSGEDASFHDCADFDGDLRRALEFKKKYGDSYIHQDAP
jgi:hypothetical protein